MRFAFIAVLSIAYAATSWAADPLPSWNDVASKRAIVAFVESVTKEGAPGFVPSAERIAVFDNDGTLWAEQPAYFQLLFALDRVKAMAPRHPEWKDREPFASLLRGDMKAVRAGGEKALAQIVAALSWKPAAIAGVADRHGRPIAVGEPANLTVFDPSQQWTVVPAQLASKSRDTPYAGRAVRGKVRHTILNGVPVVVDSTATR